MPDPSSIRLVPMLMGHPKRQGHIDVLLSRVPALLTVLDYTSSGAWPTARTAWWYAAAQLGATHVLVLQDDALVCADFLETVRVMVAARPDAALSLFSPTRMLRDLRAMGVKWYAAWHRHTGVAHVLPRTWAAELIDWADAENPRRHERWKTRSDVRVSEFVREVKRQPLWVPVPNPVNQQGESLLGHHSAGAWRSVVFPGEQAPLAGEPWGRLDAYCETCRVVVDQTCDHVSAYPPPESPLSEARP